MLKHMEMALLKFITWEGRVFPKAPAPLRIYYWSHPNGNSTLTLSVKYRNGISGHGISLDCWVLPTEEGPPKRGQTWVTSILRKTQQETPPAPEPTLCQVHWIHQHSTWTHLPSSSSSPTWRGTWGHGSAVALAVRGEKLDSRI